MDRNEVLNFVKERDVKIVQLWFPDILGMMKGFTITSEDLEKAVDEGINFDGSSIEGFVRIEESDLTAKPDLDAAYFIDWGRGESNFILICDVTFPDGKVYTSSPRYILKNTLKKAKDAGFDYYVGPELEYFYFLNNKDISLIDRKGYFDIFPYDRGMYALEKTEGILTNAGIRVEAIHHEVSENQYEIDFRYDDAIKIADRIQIAKHIVKKVADITGIYATFMPKPLFGKNGSGMHVHQSLFQNGQNAFFSETDDYHLSEIGKYYLSGLLKYSKEITSVTNQWVNSYKRLVAGYEAPAYISWGRKNRSALVRVPAFKLHNPSACRVEYRAPDPGTNPYLCFSVMLAAGLKGIQEKIEPPSPVEKNIFEMNSEERASFGINSLPDSINSAVLETEKSVLVKDTFGKEFFSKYIANKKAEWEDYKIRITDFEIKKYLPML